MFDDLFGLEVALLPLPSPVLVSPIRPGFVVAKKSGCLPACAP
jgi:hypothetical protein